MLLDLAREDPQKYGMTLVMHLSFVCHALGGFGRQAQASALQGQQQALRLIVNRQGSEQRNSDFTAWLDKLDRSLLTL